MCMTRLANSPNIALSSERARHHALRKNIRICKNSTLQQLYPLVDVLFPDSHGNEEGSRQFSGLTLDEYIYTLRPEKRAQFDKWLQQQVALIKQARQQLLYDNLPQRVDVLAYPQQLIPRLPRILERLPLQKATATQWLGVLAGAGKLGLKQEELGYSGLIDYLERHQPSNEILEKQHLLEQLDYQQIKLQVSQELYTDHGPELLFSEICKPLDGKQSTRLPLPGHKARCIARFVDKLFGYQVCLIKSGDKLLSTQQWIALDPYGKCILNPELGDAFFIDAHGARQAARHHASDHYGYRGKLRYDNRYQYVSLAGGEDYREWMVTLPNYRYSHFTPHYTERNMLMHIRSKTRYDQSGRKLLFIEEIQSDWHQAGSSKQQHYKYLPKAPFRKDWVSLALKLLLVHASKNDFQGIAWINGELLQSLYQQQLPAVARIYDQQIPSELKRMGKIWQAGPGQTVIQTSQPWLRAKRYRQYWSVSSGDGRFDTAARFTMQEAIRLIERHSKRVMLEVPCFEIPPAMAEYINTHGLPMFGHALEDSDRVQNCTHSQPS